MASSVVFQRVLLDLWAGIRGVSVSLSRGATGLVSEQVQLQDALVSASGRNRRNRQYRVWLVYCIWLLHLFVAQHAQSLSCDNDLSCECRWHRFGSTTAQPLHFSSSFSSGVWCKFCPSRMMPSDPATIRGNGAQVSRRCLPFSPAYHFGDGHAPIPNPSFILATLNDLSYLERAMSAASVFPCYPISWTSMDLFPSA